MKLNKILFVILFFSIQNIYASTIYVKSGTPVGDGSSWTNFTSLSNALSICVNGDEIWLWEGEYETVEMVENSGCGASSYLIPSGVSIYGSFSSVSESVSNRAYLDGSMILGNGQNSPLFNLVPQNTNQIVFDGIIFGDASSAVNVGSANVLLRNCYFSAFNAERGIIIGQGTINLDNCIFYSNVLGHNGAIVSVSSSNLSVKNCKFFNNSKKGAAVFCGGIFKGTNTTLNFINTTFRNNSVEDEVLGITDVNSNVLSIVNCTFYNNELQTPEDVKKLFSSVTIRNSILYNNGSTYRDDVLEYLINATQSGNLNVDYSIVPSGLLSYLGTGYAYLNTTNPQINTTTLELQSGLSNNCIDQGDNSVNSEAYDLSLSGDRISLNTSCLIDLGAYEYQDQCCVGCKKDTESTKVESLLEINVYPNPSEGVVNIKSEHEINSISFYDISGQLIFEMKNVNSDYVTFDISKYCTGVYLLNVRGESSVKSIVVTKQ